MNVVSRKPVPIFCAIGLAVIGCSAFYYFGHRPVTPDKVSKDSNTPSTLSSPATDPQSGKAPLTVEKVEDSKIPNSLSSEKFKSEPDVTHVPGSNTLQEDSASNRPPSNFRSWKDVPTEEKVRRAKEFLTLAVDAFQDKPSYGDLLAAQSYLRGLDDIKRFGGPDLQFDEQTADLFRMKADLMEKIRVRLQQEKAKD